MRSSDVVVLPVPSLSHDKPHESIYCANRMKATESPRIAIRGLLLRSHVARATMRAMGNKQPWNDWYHVTVHVYGSWLRGDPKGWRSRHHREHCEGDYRNPPPTGKYDHLYELSKSLMKRDPIRI